LVFILREKRSLKAPEYRSLGIFGPTREKLHNIMRGFIMFTLHQELEIIKLRRM
jgi:hypothetical protein